MKPTDRIALEITKALIAAKPELLENGTQDDYDLHISDALDIFERARDLVAARFTGKPLG